jgi:hypothetical protein
MLDVSASHLVYSCVPSARSLSRRGTSTVVELANDYAHTDAPFIRAAVREVGHNYRQVAKWLTRKRIPAQRAGEWKVQSVKNLVVRYWRLTGRSLLSHTRGFRPQRTAVAGLDACGSALWPISGLITNAM